MSSPVPPNVVLDRVYLEIRCKLLDIAACLDRVSRANGLADDQANAPVDKPTEGTLAVVADPRLGQIAKGIAILSSPAHDRAERIQMLFSDPYSPNWNRRKSRSTNGANPHN